MTLDTRSTYMRLLLIAATSLMVLVILWPQESTQPLVSRWQNEPVMTHPEATPAPGAQPAPIDGTAQQVIVDQFDFNLEDGLYSDQREPLSAELQQALGYVIGRFGSGPSTRFTAEVLSDGGCGLHGIAYTDVRVTQVFSCNDIGYERAVVIMAHEFVHQLSQDRYGQAHLSADLILSEGVATWGAGKYWLGGQPDFRSFVREQRRGGLFYPLATHYAGLGVVGMNALYYQWASFVEFLIDTYGREKFDQLYVTGHGDPGSSDYAGVYGKGLDVLEHEWIDWLDG